MPRIQVFDDWISMFREWQQSIGLDEPDLREHPFEAKYGDLPGPAIEFGDFRGEPRWETVRQIPEQRIRDALLNLIVYQGDTEFASVEQQRHLFETAPSDYDLRSLTRVMSEEMRHGYQMCHLLVEHFGTTGRIEAQKLLERRAFDRTRLLGSFNETVDTWLDFFVYTDFVDRDGKFQLRMLSRCAFAPLARSMGPMLHEESFHLGTGHSGLLRILKAGRIDTPLLQKYLNKWIPTAYDLFGTDHSSTAHWCYVWGLKGRFEEDPEQPADRSSLNEQARMLYHDECRALIDNLNHHVPDGQPKLEVPDLRFHRSIGDWAGFPYDLHGRRLSAEEYERHLQEVLPGANDVARVLAITSEPGWIAPKGSGRADERL
ncbi:MAG: phenylacetate-CoA oxygenase subunit PaaI [Candidatus Eisenbacteria bacterium]|nr:phenylacetate-CoA oxygenase subunit PaaI [Candidatus Eisenbacteria bacterium]